MKQLLTAEQIADDPEAWHRERASRIGASEIASALGVAGAFKSPAQLFYEKLYGVRSEPRLRWRVGLALEPLMTELVEEAEPDLALDAGGLYVSGDRDWQSATFDALGWQGAGTKPVPVQKKTAKRRDPEHWGKPPFGKFPPAYLAQVVQEIDVAEADEARLIVLFGLGEDHAIYRVERTADVEADIAFFRERGAAFHAALIAGELPPIMDGRAGTTAALRDIYRDTTGERVRIPKRLAEQWARGADAEKAGETRRRLAENRIRERLGPGTVAVDGDGHELVKRSVYDEERIDVTALRAAHPNIAAEFTKTNRIDKLLRGKALRRTDG
jgi:predicted phage-related endonuclease